MVFGAIHDVLKLETAENEMYLAEQFQKQYKNWNFHIICSKISAPEHYDLVIDDLKDRVVGAGVPVIAVYYYPQDLDVAGFKNFVEKVNKLIIPHMVIGVLPCTDHNILGLSDEEALKLNAASLGIFKIFMEFRKINVINLAHPNEFNKVGDARFYIDRLFRRSQKFFPEPKAVAPVNMIKEGILTPANAVTNARFPSKKAHEAAVAATAAVVVANKVNSHNIHI